LIDRFKASPDPRIQEIVAQVMSATIKLHRAQRHSVQAEQAVDALVAFAKATDNGFAKQEAASAMLGRASWREEAHDRPGTIAALDAVVAAFDGQTSMLAAVVEAMERKASLLAEAGRTDEAIALWNDVISRSDATGVLRTMVAPGAQSQDVSVLKALFNKAVAELGRGHREAAEQGFADVVRRYEAAPDESWQVWILAALEHQADIANALGQDDAAAGFYGKIVRLYSGSKQPGLRYGAAKSLLNRGALSARADRYADALADFSTVDALFGEDRDPAMRDNLAPAAVNRARALLRLGRKAEAVAAVDQFLLRYGKGPAKASPALIADARQIRREAKAR
jgi:tetratricopeptide (TPR) repeat protein